MCTLEFFTLVEFGPVTSLDTWWGEDFSERGPKFFNHVR